CSCHRLAPDSPAHRAEPACAASRNAAARAPSIRVLARSTSARGAPVALQESPLPAEPPSQPARSIGAGLIPESAPAVLALADGTIFRGRSIGAPGQAVGEVVFNTAMTGYQEILTDPSYCRQIVTLTY